MNEGNINKNRQEGSPNNDNSKNLKNELPDSNNSKQDFTGKVLFGKYRVIKKIGEGSQSSIYSGENIKTKESVAIKTEKQKEIDCLLKKEIYFLYRLKGQKGIADLITCGRSGEDLVLVENLLGKSLDILFLDMSKKFTLSDICQIGIQCLDRIEFVHSKGIIHCDIKPENFTIGLKDPYIIYLIDFGLCQNYKSLKSGKHIDFSFTGYMTGTARYASRHALRGKQLSRRDDIESFIYMILYFLAKTLPWQNMKAKNMAQKYKKIYLKKKNFNYKEFCMKFPPEIVTLLDYVLTLSFKEKPNYEFMRMLFKRILEREKQYKRNYFSWLDGMKVVETEIKRAHSETRNKAVAQKKKIHNSIIKLSTNNNLKESTIAVTNLKLSKLMNGSKINLGESNITIDAKDNINIEEEKIESDVEDESGKSIEDKSDGISLENLLSTGAKIKQKIEKYGDDENERKYELKKELEVIKEEDEEDEDNIPQQRGGSQHFFGINFNEFNFDKKITKNKELTKSNFKREEKLLIHTKLNEINQNNNINEINNIEKKSNNKEEINNEENEEIVKEKNEKEEIKEEVKEEVKEEAKEEIKEEVKEEIKKEEKEEVKEEIKKEEKEEVKEEIKKEEKEEVKEELKDEIKEKKEINDIQNKEEVKNGKKDEKEKQNSLSQNSNKIEENEKIENKTKNIKKEIIEDKKEFEEKKKDESKIEEEAKIINL